MKKLMLHKADSQDHIYEQRNDDNSYGEDVNLAARSGVGAAPGGFRDSGFSNNSSGIEIMTA